MAMQSGHSVRGVHKFVAGCSFLPATQDDKPVWLQLLECCQEAKRKQEEGAQRSAKLSTDILQVAQHWYPKGYPIRSHKPRA